MTLHVKQGFDPEVLTHPRALCGIARPYVKDGLPLRWRIRGSGTPYGHQPHSRYQKYLQTDISSRRDAPTRRPVRDTGHAGGLLSVGSNLWGRVFRAARLREPLPFRHASVLCGLYPHGAGTNVRGDLLCPGRRRTANRHGSGRLDPDMCLARRDDADCHAGAVQGWPSPPCTT